MNSIRKLWLKVLSSVVIVFTLFMFIAYRLYPESQEMSTLNTSSIIGLSFVGIGFIGLLLTWKWEFAGGIISLFAFVISCIFFPLLLVPSLLYIWPATAIVFILVWIKSRNTDENTK